MSTTPGASNILSRGLEARPNAGPSKLLISFELLKYCGVPAKPFNIVLLPEPGPPKGIMVSGRCACIMVTFLTERVLIAQLGGLSLIFKL